MVCTIYSHYLGFDRITDALQEFYPKGTLQLSQDGESSVAELELKGGLFSSAKKVKIRYRERAEPSFALPEIDDCPLTKNLKGLYGFVDKLPSANEKVKHLFLQKIQTLNAEFTIVQEQGETKELKPFIQSLAKAFDAVLFVQPNTPISKSAGQHFLDRNLNLIIDLEGRCEIDDLKVTIESKYWDGEQQNATADQERRKAENEQILQQFLININPHLPFTESEAETVIRTPREIAQRVCVLAITNLVAFSTISADEATAYLKRHRLWELVTPREKEFLTDPTEDRKSQESWKCECIWTLLWALNKVDDLGFPDELSDLNAIAPQNYPVDADKDPNDFINSVVAHRAKSEILDAVDLYYRLDWACVDARLNNQPMDQVIPGVVYERHYALNWLVNYMDQDWDDVTCDT